MEKDAKSFVDLTSPSAHGYMTKVDNFKEIYDKVEKASSLLRSWSNGRQKSAVK